MSITNKLKHSVPWFQPKYEGVKKIYKLLLQYHKDNTYEMYGKYVVYVSPCCWIQHNSVEGVPAMG